MSKQTECTCISHKIVLVRHGESEWLEKNLFCGWYDAKLTEKGLVQANEAANAIKTAGIKIDIAHTSLLQRARDTLQCILNVNGPDIPVCSTWRLNERHYGDLTGLNKEETAAKYGLDQVQLWRRGFDDRPPAISSSNKYYSQIVDDPRYKDLNTDVPLTESLKNTLERIQPYWDETIVPQFSEGKSILIVAHGTSLRGIVKNLDNLSDKEITKVEIPTAIPFVYELDKNMKPIGPKKYLASEDVVNQRTKEAAIIKRT